MVLLQLVHRIFLNKICSILILMSFGSISVSAQVKYLEQYKLILDDILKSREIDTIYYIVEDTCVESSVKKNICSERIKYGLPDKDEDIYILNFPLVKRHRLVFCVANSFCDTKKRQIITGGFTYYFFDKKRPRRILSKKNSAI